jgi:uncharacterized protein (DUF1697 family)
MSALKGCVEKAGFDDVATHIQSGNVLFSSSQRSVDGLTERMEQALSKEFGYKSRVVVVPHEALREAVGGAPAGFGETPDAYRYDVIFLKKPLTAREALKSVKVKEGVDAAYEGKGVLYFSRLIEKASQSQLSRIVGLPVYQNMTIRNWNTTTKLLGLLDARSKNE